MAASSSTGSKSISVNTGPDKLLEGYKVCVDGFTAGEADKIRKIICHLGGVYVAGLCFDGTCLITKRVGAEYKEAKRNGIQTITVNWLIDCFSKKKRLGFEAYMVAPFHGLVIACSRLHSTSREQIKNLVESNGGKYSEELSKFTTTHLVTIDNQGEKYRYASQWQTVSIVKANWVDDCVARKGTVTFNFK